MISSGVHWVLVMFFALPGRPATVDLNPDDVRVFPSQALCEMATRRVQWAMPVREQQGLGLMCAPAEDFGE